MRALIVSDVHLFDLHDRRGRHFFSFLRQEAPRLDRLYVLGDLFDVWPGSSPLLVKRFQPLFDFFSEFVRNGGQIHYVEGNHDFQLGKKLSESIGFRVHHDQIHENWDGRKVLLCHGDTVNEHDVTYLKVRRFFRSRWFRLLRASLPDRVAVYLGTTASRYSRESQLKRPDAEARLGRVKARYREIVHGLFEAGNDVVVMGHTHIPEDYRAEVGGRTCQYLNSGDWVKSFTFIRYEAGAFSLHRHPLEKPDAQA